MRRLVMGAIALAVTTGQMTVAKAVDFVPRTEELVPPEYQAAILLRAMKFDRNLRARAGTTVDIAVLFDAKNGDSERESQEILTALRLLEGNRLVGLPWKVSEQPYTGATTVSELAAKGVDAIYVCIGLRAAVPEIRAATQQHRVLSMAGHEEYVRAGLSLGTILDEGRPRLLANRQSLKGEQVELASSLISLATVIE